jgi:hypothetical protein
VSERIDIELQLPPELRLRVLAPPAQLPADMAQVIAGRPGPAGGSAFTRYTPAALSALRIVWEDADGAVYLLDPADDAHCDLISGLTLTATPGAGDVTVQRSGPVDDTAWNWTPGRVWLGAAGSPTQTPPQDETDVLIGYAVSPTRLFLDIQDPIFQED